MSALERFYCIPDGMQRLSKKYMTHLREVPDDQVALPNQNIRITDTSVLQTNARRWNVNNRKIRRSAWNERRGNWYIPLWYKPYCKHQPMSRRQIEFYVMNFDTGLQVLTTLFVHVLVYLAASQDRPGKFV